MTPAGERRRIMFVFLRTGGGHEAPARAVARELAELHAAEIEAELVDPLRDGSTFARLVLEEGYRRLQAHAIWLYEAIYAANKFTPLARFNCALASLWLRPPVVRHIRSGRPDLIVVAHFLLVRPVQDALRRLGLSTPVVTLVTDPATAHPMWFLDPHQELVVCTERLRRHVAKLGFPPGRVHVAPFPVERLYEVPVTPAGRDAARARFAVAPGKPAVLLLGGGDGLPRGAAILHALLGSGLEARFLMVCGRNEPLLQQAGAVLERHPGADAALYGFVPFVHDLLSAADVVIAKPGASTAMQVALMGVRPVITDYMWEQEKGNVDAITAGGFGIYEPKVHRVPDAVRRLLALGPVRPDPALRGGARRIAGLLAARAGIPSDHSS
jgi:processive 1,2-diacylglycerol beta-glucosyltransferase/1,2-diacylglycerol 3-beta-galactosyltransferase